MFAFNNPAGDFTLRVRALLHVLTIVLRGQRLMKLCEKYANKRLWRRVRVHEVHIQPN